MGDAIGARDVREEVDDNVRSVEGARCPMTPVDPVITISCMQG
jgi:hypothetical protein